MKDSLSEQPFYCIRTASDQLWIDAQALAQLEIPENVARKRFRSEKVKLKSGQKKEFYDLSRLFNDIENYLTADLEHPTVQVAGTVKEWKMFLRNTGLSGKIRNHELDLSYLLKYRPQITPNPFFVKIKKEIQYDGQPVFTSLLALPRDSFALLLAQRTDTLGLLARTALENREFQLPELNKYYYDATSLCEYARQRLDTDANNFALYYAPVRNRESLLLYKTGWYNIDRFLKQELQTYQIQLEKGHELPSLYIVGAEDRVVVSEPYGVKYDSETGILRFPFPKRKDFYIVARTHTELAIVRRVHATENPKELPQLVFRPMSRKQYHAALAEMS